MSVVTSTPQMVLFGGSFDPFHLGHEHIITTLLQLPSAPSIWVIPAFLNPFKTHNLFTPNQRLRWIKESLSNMPKACVQVSHFELDQQRSVPTFETLQYFQAQFPHVKFGFVIGEDQLPNLCRWFCFEKLRQEVIFLIFARQGYGAYSSEILDQIDYLWFDYDCPISASLIREGLTKKDRSVLQYLSPLIVHEFDEWFN